MAEGMPLWPFFYMSKSGRRVSKVYLADTAECVLMYVALKMIDTKLGIIKFCPTGNAQVVYFRIGLFVLESRILTVKVDMTLVAVRLAVCLYSLVMLFERLCICPPFSALNTYIWVRYVIGLDVRPPGFAVLEVNVTVLTVSPAMATTFLPMLLASSP